MACQLESQWLENCLKKPVSNRDLWQQLDAVSRQHQVYWHWVKGHAGHEGNERADQLANLGADTHVRQIILDTETTGLDPKDGHRIVEIGCIELVNRQLTDRTFHVYINPEREIDQEVIDVHGITNEFLADKPNFAGIADEFVEFIRDAELIAHNASFDINFLDSELSRIPGVPNIFSLMHGRAPSTR